VTFMPSFHTLNAHIRAGARLGASLDGRRAGQPLAKNIGPVLGRRTGGHTALMLSAAAIDQSAFFGGQALDISFELAQLASASGREAFRALLQSYFDLGGLQVQVNGLDASALREAMESPADHQDLIVRVAGYSAQFVGLDRDTQAEMVQRRSGGL
jgi:pyruvate-formate lyase